MKLDFRLIPFLFLTLVAGSALARGELLQESTETYALDEGGSISLDNVNGDVTVEAWEGNDVRVEFRIYGSSDKQLDKVKVRVNSDPSHISIETHYDKSKNRSSYQSENE